MAGTGDVEGRVAIADNCHLGSGFSIGFEIHSAGPNRTDNNLPWSLAVGGNLTWESGALFPDGTTASPKEGFYLSGMFTGPGYLGERMTGGPTPPAKPAFEAIRPWYVSLGEKFAAAPTNMQATFMNGGIFLTFGDQYASRYYVHINAADFQAATFVTASGVNVGAEFIVTIDGGDVHFTGGDIPSIAEKTVFNIVGNRNIYNEHNAKGSVLAPNSVLYQTGGDQIGFVAVGDIQKFVETRKPFCNIMCCVKWGPCNQPEF